MSLTLQLVLGMVVALCLGCQDFDQAVAGSGHYQVV